MSVFAVVGDDNVSPETLADAVKKAFPERNYRHGLRAHFVAAKGMTSRQAAEALGVKQAGGIIGVVVVRLAGSYWGVANPDLWPWLKGAIENDDG